MVLFIKKVWRKLFQQQVYVFGDSHTEVFLRMNEKRPFYKYRFHVTRVGGATAQGMRNPNSKTNALAVFKEQAQKIASKRSKVFLLLGEVDTGFVIWYRAQKYNEQVETQLNESVSAYFGFIDDLLKMGFKNITVFSASLPTIEDGQTWGEIANARKEITATKKERTELTFRYNDMLKTECKKRGIRYIGYDRDLTDPATGLIHERFKNTDPNNHHLDVDLYADLVFSKLK
jgi:hypothetical protein